MLRYSIMCIWRETSSWHGAVKGEKRHSINEAQRAQRKGAWRLMWHSGRKKRRKQRLKTAANMCAPA